MESVRENAIKMLNLLEELQNYQSYKKNLVEELREGGEEAAKKLLKGKNKDEVLDHYNLYILQLISHIDNLNEGINNLAESGNIDTPLKEERKPAEHKTIEIKPEIDIEPKELSAPAEPEEQLKPVKEPEPLPEKELPKSTVSLDKGKFEIVKINKKERKRLIKELGIDDKRLHSLYKKSGQKKAAEDYTLYKENFYGRFANTFFKGLALKLSKKHYSNLRHDIVRADIKLLSTTYISSMFFTSILAMLLVFAVTFVYSYLTGASVINTILRSIFFSLISIFLSYFVYYNYPSFVANSRRRAIKNDLPFVMIHMAAVAGSGAHPLAMFHLVLTTGEYKGIEGEIKRILNYVNLFGYNLTSALRAVSITTPSKEFRDFLNGIVSVVESGGDLKSYLSGKADDAMNNYKLERKKYVETLSTYSDIYIGVLLAAPLLFIVTLTIINLLGGEIAGLTADSIAFFGTYIGMPVLNVIFILFLNIIQPDV